MGEHVIDVVEQTRVERRTIAVGDIDEFRLELEPALVAPRFALGEGARLDSVGLHHNSWEFAKRYAPLLANAPKRSYARHATGETYVVGGAPNFYHFITNYLVRLYYYRDGDPVRSRYVVADGLPSHYYDFFPLLGIPPAALFKVSFEQYSEFPRAVVANLPHYMTPSGLKADPRAFGWVRERVLGRAPFGPRRRIMLSRSKAPHRRVVNEDELFAVAARYGFVRVLPEDYKVRELVELLATAEVLVSPFGAGSTNSLFCPSDCVIVDLTGRHGLRKLNSAVLCAVADQACIRVVGEELELEKNWQYRDTRYDPQSFEHALKMATGAG
jgi:hypothetical protein